MPSAARKSRIAEKAAEFVRSGDRGGAVKPAPMPNHNQDEIARAAYFLALSREFAPGHELDDWLAAERDVKAAGDSAP